MNECSHIYKFDFTFENLGKVIVHTEYLLYDFISTLGNVGGTLGLFIGISFSGIISCILNVLVNACEYFESLLGHGKSINSAKLVEHNSNEVSISGDEILNASHQNLESNQECSINKLVTQDMLNEFEEKMKVKEDEIINKLKEMMAQLSELKRKVHFK